MTRRAPAKPAPKQRVKLLTVLDEFTAAGMDVLADAPTGIIVAWHGREGFQVAVCTLNNSVMDAGLRDQLNRSELGNTKRKARARA
jgi:hypothetical protein